MRCPRLIAATALAVLPVVLALAACGDGEGSAPVACLEGEGAYLAALENAPGEVLLGGEAPIGDCLTENQEGGALADVGTAMLAAATTLNAQARAEPGGDANLRLGYLIGAAQRGSERTDGIHAELVRRLSVAARYSPGKQVLPPLFLRTYREGYDAGLAGG